MSSIDTVSSDSQSVPPIIQGVQLSERPVGKGLSVGTPSVPMFGKLPIARLIPQDVHTVLDYVVVAQALTSAILAEDAVCRSVGILKAVMVTGLSACTDYRLSFAKLIPIEVHEAADYFTAISMAAAPFVLGYWKKSPLASMIQVVGGIAYLGASLVTDYRAARGVKWPRANAALA